MASLYLLLLLPSLAFATIGVQVSGKFTLDSQYLKLNFSGSETNVISDAEINTFQLWKENVMRGVENHYGERPDNVYLKSPSPWGGQNNEWTQVRRSFKPLRGKILSIRSKKEVMIQQIFENSRRRPALFDIAISERVMNTIKTSWSSSEHLSLNDIKYKFDFVVGGVNRGTYLNYTMAYGENQKKSTSIILGAIAPIEFRLQPGQSMMAELTATRGSVILEMEYEASLSGSVVANYHNRYQGHHYWELDIKTVIEAAGLRRKLVNKQIVELEFYSDSRIVVRPHRPLKVSVSGP